MLIQNLTRVNLKEKHIFCINSPDLFEEILFISGGVIIEKDLLYSSANFYKEELLSKFFVLKVERKKETLDLKIKFTEENFKHLIGIEKLNDIGIYKNKSSAILNGILRMKIKNADIEKSSKYDYIEDRIRNFKYIKKCLSDNKVALKKLDKCTFNTIDADFLFTIKIEDYYLNLFIKKCLNDDIYLPVTFFSAPTDKYSTNTVKYKIISYEER